MVMTSIPCLMYLAFKNVWAGLFYVHSPWLHALDPSPWAKLKIYVTITPKFIFSKILKEVNSYDHLIRVYAEAFNYRIFMRFPLRPLMNFLEPLSADVLTS